MEKPPKLNEKTRRKTKGLINEKLPKLNEETRKKIDHLYVAAVKNFLSLS